jgi:hypothetical protein
VTPRITTSRTAPLVEPVADTAEPAAWATAASALRAQATANDTGWGPATALTTTDLDQPGRPLATPPAPVTPAAPEPAIDPGPDAGANGDDATSADDPAAWAYGLSGVDTRVPRPPGVPDTRPRSRRWSRRSDDRPGTPATNGHGSAVTPAPGKTTDPGPDEAGTEADHGGEPAVQRDRQLTILIVGVVVVVLAGLGAALLLGGGGDDKSDRTATSGTESSGATQPSTTGVATLTPAQAFAQASQRLETAGSFAYHGTSSATDVSPARPGQWLAVGLTVDGQVQLKSSFRLLDRGTASDGSMVDTVTDGATIWGRTAPSLEALAQQPVGFVYTLPAPHPNRVGAARLPQWLAAAVNPTDGGPDPQGRRTFKATLPANVLGRVDRNHPAADAEMAVTLDDAGNPVHVRVTGGTDEAPLELVFDLSRLGETMTIALPDDPASSGGQTTQTTATTATSAG